MSIEYGGQKRDRKGNGIPSQEPVSTSQMPVIENNRTDSTMNMCIILARAALIVLVDRKKTRRMVRRSRAGGLMPVDITRSLGRLASLIEVKPFNNAEEKEEIQLMSDGYTLEPERDSVANYRSQCVAFAALLDTPNDSLASIVKVETLIPPHLSLIKVEKHLWIFPQTPELIAEYVVCGHTSQEEIQNPTYAFHGSSMFNWWSILRSGFKIPDVLGGVMQHGHGVYFSKDLHVSWGYSPPSSIPKVHLEREGLYDEILGGERQDMNIIAVCKVNGSDEVENYAATEYGIDGNIILCNEKQCQIVALLVFRPTRHPFRPDEYVNRGEELRGKQYSITNETTQTIETLLQTIVPG